MSIPYPLTYDGGYFISVGCNHNFPDKEILTLHVPEEANLGGINFVCSQSDVRDFKCTGYRFCVIAHQSKPRGWLVNTACVCKGDEFVEFNDTPTKAPREAKISILDKVDRASHPSGYRGYSWHIKQESKTIPIGIWQGPRAH